MEALTTNKTRTYLPVFSNTTTEAFSQEIPAAPSGSVLYQPSAGHPDWPTLEREAHALAMELLPTLTRRDPMKTALRRARSVRTATQNFLENRRRAKAGREDFLPLYFIWTTHRTCNFLCSYCDDHRGRRYPELPTEGTLDTTQARSVLQRLRSRCSSVYFAGGEPTLRKDLPELTHHAAELGFYPLVVNTNGSALHKLLKLPAWRSWLAEIDTIVVSLDALDLRVLAKMWQYPHPEDVLRNLLLLHELSKELGFKLAVNTVIQPGLVHHAKDVLDFVNDRGIWFSPVPMNEGPTVSGSLRNDPAFAALRDTILERKQQGYRIQGSLRLNQRLLSSAPLDCRNSLKPHIDYDGTLFWPCKSAVNVRPEELRVLDYPDVDTLWAAARSKRDPKNFHGPGPEQCGGNCNWAQNYTTDAYAHGLQHPWSLVREVVEFLSPGHGNAKRSNARSWS